jgi:nicotinamide mononucleotide adenylyltransferase
MMASATKKLKSISERVCLVACGSFNPPTIMHLRLLEQCRDHLTQQGFEVTGGYLSPVGDGYKKRGLLPSVHRVKMCEEAAAESTWIKCDSWEASQETHILTRTVLERFSGS